MLTGIPGGALLLNRQKIETNDPAASLPDIRQNCLISGKGCHVKFITFILQPKCQRETKSERFVDVGVI